MFDIISQLICSFATFLFPVFASYKALKANDPSHLTPWLMYWVVIGCISFVESWTGWFLVWIPFYQPVRACFMLWLVLPQTQGATQLYVEYVHPELEKHEVEIEAFITRAHAQAKSAIVQNIRRLVDYIKASIFGPQAVSKPATRPPTPSPQEPSSYAQSLFARWRVPPLSSAAPQLATDFYNFLSSALQQQEGSSSSGAESPIARSLSGSSTLIPPNVRTPAEKRRFVELQRQRLGMVMSALEQEMQNLGAVPGGYTSAAGSVEAAAEGLGARSPSQGNLSTLSGEFDHVEMDEDEEGTPQPQAPPPHQRSSSWLFGWGGGAGTPGEEDKPHRE